jgi:hypothetical protein
MAMALAADTPLELRFQCHRELAQYVLAKLKAMEMSGEVEHHHTSEPLQVLFGRLEQEEEAKRASLPPWTPPGPEALDMRQSADGEWDFDEDEA